MKPLNISRIMSALAMSAILVASSAALLASAGSPTVQRAPALPPQGNAASGMRLYQSCMGCHSLDENEVGPKHRGVIGRRAGSVPGYSYSPALRSSGIVWTPRNIDRWLTNPQRMVPGAKMYFSVAKPQDRADIIAYLTQQR